MSTPNIKLAFQGGGARLIPMLAVAEAFCNAQKAGLVKIVEVSGTSAGAICAAIIAIGGNFEKLRNTIVQNGPNQVSSLIPPEVAKIKAEIDNSKKISMYQVWKHRSIIRDILINGKPILSEEILPKFVKEILIAATGSSEHNIEDCNPKLTVISSNVAKSVGVNETSGDLVNAVVDSCSLPVLLRSFDALSATHHVDGGLCDNLPVELLLGENHIPVFAIYPKPKEGNTKVDNLFSYISSLFSASINHNAKRSQSMVSEPFRFEIDTDINMLDFEKAIHLIENKEQYNSIRDRFYDRIENFSRSFGVKNTTNQSRVIDIVNTEEYESCLSNITSDYTQYIEFKKATFLVKVNCDTSYESVHAIKKRLPDTVRRTTEFKSEIDGLKYYLASVVVSKDSIVPTVWSVRNITQNIDIPIRALPLGERSDTGFPARYCLIEFINPHNYIQKDDVIEVEGIYHSPEANDMRLLNTKQSDFLGIMNTQNTMPIADLILIYPKKLGKINMHASEQKSSRSVKDFVPAEFTADHRLMLDNGFDLIGMRVCNLKSMEKMYVNVHFNNE